MRIIEKNAGPKLPYEVSGTKLCFDDDLTVNLSKRQEDEPVHLDICTDWRGQLVLGTANGRAFVAEIDIPAREYRTAGAEEEAAEPLPLDMNDVTLTLWAVE